MSPPSQELQVNLLGTVRIRSDGRRVDITSGRVVSLLAYLILHRSERQARSRIAYLFWPESSDGQARTNLRQLLHQVRRVVPFASGVVGTDAESVWWDGQGAVASDVIVFEEAIEAAEGKPTTAALTEAVNAYGGDLLPGYWDDWVLDERERLRSRWLALSGQLCDRLVHQGHYRAAIRALQRHLVVEPTDEQAHRRLMGVHAACGERTRALQVFHRCERVLRRELDVEPSDATRELYGQLVSVPLAPTPVARRAGLVGRTDELAHLREAWRRVADTGRSVLVLVTGEAGIGKTALVDEACRWCEQQGATAAWATCYDVAAGLSLAPVAAWLRHPALGRALDGLDGPWRREVARVLPELDEAVATPDHPLPGDRRRLFEALVRGLTGVERLVLVVDDLQWSDPDTIDLLAYLLTEHATEGLLVVATARDGPIGSIGALGDLRTTLSVRDQLVTVALAALDGEACAELARSAGGEGLRPEQVVRAVQDSGGNPLFCIEIARAAKLAGPDVAAAATPRIRAVIEQRLSTLSPSAAEVAEIAAVVGRSFDAHLLVAASELSEADLADGLDELWHHRIVADTGPAAYDFTHDKLREVAYERLAPARRRMGEPAQGRDSILAGIAAMAETGQVLHRSFGLWLLARALLLCGEPTAARAALVEASEHAQLTGQHYLDREVERVLDGLSPHGRQGNAPQNARRTVRRPPSPRRSYPATRRHLMHGINRLRERVTGTVLTPESADYHPSRSVYNAMIDRSPQVIVRAADAGDVQAAVDLARDDELDLAVRGGSHSVPGFGTCDGGVVCDLGGMRRVEVDPATRIARVDGGALLRDLDLATHRYGLATPGGFISTTGVGGLTVGGGISAYLSRRFGLTCENLVAAEVVTADGQLVTASEDSNADLFWALRGGGGNFGVVTSFTFRLHPLGDPPGEVVGGPIFFELDAAAEVMAAWRDYMANAPRELGGFFAFQIAPPLPFIPEERHGETFCAVMTSWVGPASEAGRALAPIRASGPVVAEHVGTLAFPSLQSAFDDLVPAGLQHYWKADFVADLTDDAIAVHLDHGSRVPCVTSTMHLYPMNGAVRDVEPAATAFAHRDAAFAAVIAGMWPDPNDNAANIEWVRDYHAAIHPHSGHEGGYTNFMAGDDQERVRANYGPNYDRLAEIKARWDPHNLFHLNQNIEPARTAGNAQVGR